MSARDDGRLKALLRLRSIDFFDGLDAKQLAAIAAISTEETYQRGDVVFEQGDMGDHMYILLAGGVEVVRDGERIATIDSGDCFGEGAVLERVAQLRHHRGTRGFHTLGGHRTSGPIRAAGALPFRCAGHRDDAGCSSSCAVG